MLGAAGMTLLVWGIILGAPELIHEHTEWGKGTGSGAKKLQFKSQLDHLVTGELADLSVSEFSPTNRDNKMCLPSLQKSLDRLDMVKRAPSVPR